MKKFIFTLAFVCSMAMGFTACGTNGNSNGVDSDSVADTTLVVDTVADSVAVDSVCNL